MSEKTEYTSPLEKKLDRLTVTESKIYKEIVEFKEPDDKLFERFGDAIDLPFDKLADALEGKRLATTLGNLLSAALSTMNDYIAGTVPSEEIVERFQDKGHDVDSVEDLRDLTIDDIEPLVKRVNRKYSALATGEGIVTGFAGLPGTLIDLPALMGLSLRAAGETAVYYGFTPEKAFERKFGVLILAIASASTDESQDELFEALDDVLQQDHNNAQPLPNKLVQQVAQAIVLRILRGKIAQVVPVVGAVVGGGYNKAFVGQVCDTARRLYQERWLLERHGDDDRSTG